MVKLFANLRQIAGTNEVIVPGTSISEILIALVDRFPELDQLLIELDVQMNFIITKNGFHVIDRNTIVTEQDEIAIFPPLGGG